MPRLARESLGTSIYHVMMLGILPPMYTIIIANIQGMVICSTSGLKVSQ